MSVTFRLPSERPLDLVRFAWSPMVEAVLSLPVISEPKRTPMHLPWARRCRDLPPDLVSEIRLLSRPFHGFVPGIFEVGLTGDSTDFADELAAFRDLDDRLVSYELTYAFGGYGCEVLQEHGQDSDTRLDLVDDPDYREQTIAAAGAGGAEVVELTRQAFDDPRALRERLADMLERYWDEAFGTEWERLLPRIEAEVTDGALALVTRGIPGLIEELLPEGSWDAATNTVTVEKRYPADCDVEARGGMLFVPTVYGWPRVLIELATPWPVAVIFPLRDLRQPEVPNAADHEVADGLRALGDETRLQIARMVAEQPRSTKELAELLSLSDSAVSRHLKILDGAGIVSGQRDGYFVLYRLEPQRIGQLGGALRQTLGLAQAAGAGAVPPLPVSLSRASSARTS